LRRYQRARGDHRTAGGQVRNLVGVVRQRVLRDDLDRIEARTVADVDERQTRFRIAPRAHPALDRDLAVFPRLARADRTRQRLLYADYRHTLKLRGFGPTAERGRSFFRSP